MRKLRAWFQKMTYIAGDGSERREILKEASELVDISATHAT